MNIPLEISARHAHISQKDLEKIFGLNYKLTKKNDLSQPGEFAAEESLHVVGPRGELTLRIIGPLRFQTQIELSQSDARTLGIDAPLRLSGDLQNSGKVMIAGPVGSIELAEGVIIAKRHLHISTTEAVKLNLANGEKISVKILGERAGQLDEIIVRSGENFKLALHIDTDEANALGISVHNCTAKLI